MSNKASRRRTREEMMKIIFQVSFHDELSEESLLKLIAPRLRKEEKKYAESLLKAFCSHREEIDEAIKKSSKKWSFHRIGKVDLAILRTAVTEILYLDEIPKEVAINEAMEISKVFSGEDSYAFINGVLGHVVEGL